MKIKFVARRAVAGIAIVPTVAGAYFAGYALLVGAGAGANATPSEVWTNGLWLGALATLSFMFWEKLMQLLEKLGGN